MALDHQWHCASMLVIAVLGERHCRDLQTQAHASGEVAQEEVIWMHNATYEDGSVGDNKVYMIDSLGCNFLLNLQVVSVDGVSSVQAHTSYADYRYCPRSTAIVVLSHVCVCNMVAVFDRRCVDVDLDSMGS
jgi:hypothetical protein